ncbi:MAG: hypothetical protein OZSIB_0022 [Candidatus Ozemobacter sibiricus]|uniref:Uncharacterized protein n=1 Tax=Candidatus Ozemobacter sibiricus TaxID=2268124 RepID=A0A367ZPS3_9BACT|nr:MAG: hypothetical protein OZSIB_0022 [Candidatus Ozemobacter sibiricus]
MSSPLLGGGRPARPAGPFLSLPGLRCARGLSSPDLPRGAKRPVTVRAPAPSFSARFPRGGAGRQEVR